MVDWRLRKSLLNLPKLPSCNVSLRLVFGISQFACNWMRHLTILQTLVSMGTPTLTWVTRFSSVEKIRTRNFFPLVGCTTSSSRKFLFAKSTNLFFLQGLFDFSREWFSWRPPWSWLSCYGSALWGARFGNAWCLRLDWGTVLTVLSISSPMTCGVSMLQQVDLRCFCTYIATPLPCLMGWSIL